MVISNPITLTMTSNCHNLLPTKSVRRLQARCLLICVLIWKLAWRKVGFEPHLACWQHSYVLEGSWNPSSPSSPCQLYALWTFSVCLFVLSSWHGAGGVISLVCQNNIMWQSISIEGDIPSPCWLEAGHRPCSFSSGSDWATPEQSLGSP